MKAKLTRVQKFNIPKIDLGQETMSEIGEEAKASIIENIERGETADGASLKRNESSTVKQKAGSRPLIGKNGRILNGLKVTLDRDGVNVEPGSDEVRRIIGYVAAKGYVGWFAINSRGREKIREIIRERMRQLFGGAQ